MKESDNSLISESPWLWSALDTETGISSELHAHLGRHNEVSLSLALPALEPRFNGSDALAVHPSRAIARNVASANAFEVPAAVCGRTVPAASPMSAQRPCSRGCGATVLHRLEKQFGALDQLPKNGREAGRCQLVNLGLGATTNVASRHERAIKASGLASENRR